jgi:hypothetical protein
VFDGTGEARSFLISDSGEVAISLRDVHALGSMAAIEVHFASAEVIIPPFVLLGSESTGT